jgi:hypothetical protein
VFSREAEPGLDLGAVVAGVEDTPPEDPDALTGEVVEEGTLGEPPRRCVGGELREAEFAEVDVFFDVGGDGRRVTGWEKLVSWGFLGANELGEEAAFGEELVGEDRADRVYFFLGAEVEAVVWNGTPHAGGLVALADVGVDDMLPLRLGGSRNFSVGDGGEVVVHGKYFTWPRLSETRIRVSEKLDYRGFVLGSELDFLFHKSLILHGAVFASVVWARCCEFDGTHEGLNIGHWLIK